MGEDPALPTPRRAVLGFALSLLVLCGACGLVGLLLGPRFVEIGEAWVRVAGSTGVVLAVTAAETSPIPLMGEPFLLAAQAGGMSLGRVLWLGILGNLLAAAVCWVGGRALAGTRLVERLLGARYPLAAEAVRRHGAWALVLASFTPLPFGTLAWVAGALRMPLGRYALASLSRIPKVVGYVLLIYGVLRATR